MKLLLIVGTIVRRRTLAMRSRFMVMHIVNACLCIEESMDNHDYMVMKIHAKD